MELYGDEGVDHILSYRQMKWLILITPTLTIGLWEYVRHEFLLDYISMDLGNWLAPVIVFFVTMLFLTQLFAMMEHNQDELNASKAVQAAMRERETIARELHDGVAQSLFLLSAQVERMERQGRGEAELLSELRGTVHKTNAYVREAIASLRMPASGKELPWRQSLNSLMDSIRHDTGLSVLLDWQLPESRLSPRERIELLASVREALVNVHKHAEATMVKVEAAELSEGWLCSIADNGKGLDTADADGGSQSQYGLKMMEERAAALGWQYSIGREHGWTVVTLRKEERI